MSQGLSPCFLVRAFFCGKVRMKNDSGSEFRNFSYGREGDNNKRPGRVNGL